jgi:hypothetical protein
MKENPKPQNQPKVKIGLRLEVALVLVFVLTVSGLVMTIYAFLSNQVSMLAIGLISMTIAGGCGLYLLNLRFPRKK